VTMVTGLVGYVVLNSLDLLHAVKLYRSGVDIAGL
jgi:hypothetical protein